MKNLSLLLFLIAAPALAQDALHASGEYIPMNDSLQAACYAVSGCDQTTSDDILALAQDGEKVVITQTQRVTYLEQRMRNAENAIVALKHKLDEANVKIDTKPATTIVERQTTVIAPAPRSPFQEQRDANDRYEQEKRERFQQKLKDGWEPPGLGHN